jgi:hypothetical protein
LDYSDALTLIEGVFVEFLIYEISTGRKKIVSSEYLGLGRCGDRHGYKRDGN